MINVNLLPPEIKKEIAQSKKNRDVLRYLRIAVLFLLIAISVIAASFIYLDGQLRNSRSILAKKEESISDYNLVENKSKKLAERIGNIKQIMAQTNSWSQTIDEITKIMPEGVYLTSVKLDGNIKTRAKISGNALSKKEVAALREAMEKSEKFEFVDIESSNTVYDQRSKRDLENFILSFSISQGALR